MKSSTTSGGLSFWKRSQEPSGWEIEPGAMLLTRDAVGDEAEGGVLGGGDEGGLGCHVGEVAAVFPAVDGGDVDDAAPLLGAHVGDDFAHELVAAEEVEVEGCLEVFEGEVGDWLAGAGAAGVVDENVYGADAVDDGLIEGGHGFGVGDVGDDALTADSEGFDFGDGAVEGGLGADRRWRR